MSSNDYHFTTHWRMLASIQEVFDIISDAEDLVRWWPSVYLKVHIVEPGDENHIGKVVDLYTTGWLPYTLRWQFRIVEADPPHRFVLEAWGDFVGRGEWTLEQDGDWVDVYYDWRIRADKPMLRYLSFLFRPFFAANHHWAMDRGDESLWLELARRQAASPEEAARVPPPPGPTTIASPPFMLALAACLIAGLGLAAYLWNRRVKFQF
jgi:hypothetical protein